MTLAFPITLSVYYSASVKKNYLILFRLRNHRLANISCYVKQLNLSSSPALHRQLKGDREQGSVVDWRGHGCWQLVECSREWNKAASQPEVRYRTQIYTLAPAQSQPACLRRKVAFSSFLFCLILGWDNESERVMKASQLPWGNFTHLITSASSGELEICFLGASAISLGLIPRKIDVYHASKPSISNLYLVSACEMDSWSSVELTRNITFEGRHIEDIVISFSA